MIKNALIDRIAQKANITPDEAFEALAASYQGLIESSFGKVLTTISLAPDATKPAQMFIEVQNPPQPHIVRQPTGLLAYIAGRVGISNDAAAIALGVILEQITSIAHEAGARTPR